MTTPQFIGSSMTYLASLFVAFGVAVMCGGVVGANRYLKYGELSVEHLVGFRFVTFLGALMFAAGLMLLGAI